MRLVLLIAICLAVIATSRGVPAGFAYQVEPTQISRALGKDVSSLRRCVTKAAVGGASAIVCPDPRITSEMFALSASAASGEQARPMLRPMGAGVVPSPERDPPRRAS